MNAKTAKSLRNFAAQVHNPSKPTVYAVGASRTIRVHPNCYRGLYRDLKRYEAR